jgi:hypothetical protein
MVVVVIALCWHWHHSTHDPPHKQLLVGLGAGGVSLVAIHDGGGHCPALALALFYPRSTPRAVAHGAGGGWCFGVVWTVSHWFLSLVVA